MCRIPVCTGILLLILFYIENGFCMFIIYQLFLFWFFEMLLIVLFSLIVLWLFFVFFFPQFYICELAISFLPYICAASWILFILSFLFRKKKYFSKVFPLFILLFGLVFFLYSRKYWAFYIWEWFSWNSWVKQWLDILYSNILYKTKNYDDLKQWVLDNEADMVLMVEYTDDFNQNMWDVLNEKYPYSSRVEYSDKYYWNVVFSKYPIKSLTEEMEWWKWRYSYFSVNYSGVDYYIYLVHTAAPVSLKHFRMRNNQIQELIWDFAGKTSWENDRVLVIWDFNLSPWSYYYSNLEEWLKNMINLTKNYSRLFTRSLDKIWLISSHIDQIFINSGASVEEIIQVNTPWSDHKWFLIRNFK